jgi:hypothetical protein
MISLVKEVRSFKKIYLLSKTYHLLLKYRRYPYRFTDHTSWNIFPLHHKLFSCVQPKRLLLYY